MLQSRIMRGVLVVVLLALTACANEPLIRVDQAQEANFGHYRSFAFAPNLGTDAGGYASLISQRLKEAASREMLARGYRLDEKNPDLLVNFYARSEDRLRVLPGPAYPYGPWWRDPWSGGRTIDQYRESTLNVDLIERSSKRLVWEGEAVGIDRSWREAETQADIDRTIGLIFARYPYRAGTL